jgi:hypothetical protein
MALFIKYSSLLKSNNSALKDNTQVATWKDLSQKGTFHLGREQNYWYINKVLKIVH